LRLIEDGLGKWGLMLVRKPGLGTEILWTGNKYRYRLISIIRSVLDENEIIMLRLWKKRRVEENYTERNILKAKILK
jgi:hypothetical protein